MPIQQPFEQSCERFCVHRRFRAAVAACLWKFGFALLLPQLLYGQQFEAGRLLLDNARIIVGDGTVIESGSLLIVGDRIAALGSDSASLSDADVEVIDLRGKTIMPALIDSHAHLGYEGHTSWGADNYSRENLIDHLQRYAFYGFSAVFSAGSDPVELAFEVQ